MFEFNIDKDTNKYNKIYFIGIGGISMSGLAEILVSEGYEVYGSDSRESLTIERLRKLGVGINIGHYEKNIGQDIDLVIYTDAVARDNVELKKATALGIDLIDRASFLGAIMKNYRHSVAVSGTHGKTTTTSMLTTIFTQQKKMDPTILLGGQFKDIGGNIKLGSRDLILTEACEYKGNILKYFPTVGIIMNVDEDHLDYFKNIDHIVDTFSEFASNLGQNNHLVINIDDEHAQKIITATRGKIVSFAIDKEADFQAKNIKHTKKTTEYDLYVNGSFKTTISLNLIGDHNVYNSLGAIATSHIYKIPLEDISSSLKKYSGVGRRLEFKGYFRDIKVVDDYAHHPTEIKATLSALKESTEGRVFCVFQPHTFTRTKKLFNSFASSFSNADKAIITDIYAARELNDGSINSKELVDAIDNTDAIYIQDFKDIENYLIENVQSDDVIVTMGAGNIYELGEDLLKTSSAAV